MRWPLAIISLLLPFVFLPLAFDPFQLPKETLFHLATLAVLGPWLWTVFRAGSVRLAKTGVAVPVLLFLFIGLLSVFQAPYKVEALATVRDATCAVVIFFLAAASLSPEDRLVPNCLGLAALATATLGLSQSLLGPYIPWLPSTQGGALVGDVTTAAVCRGNWAWIWTAGSGVAAGFVVLSRTRAAWLALMAGALCLVALAVRTSSSREQDSASSGSSRRLHLFASGALALLIVLWGVYGAGIVLFSNPPSFKTSELQGWVLREDAWRVTRSMIFAHPLGAGAGNWRYVFASEAGAARPRTGFGATRLPLQCGNEILQITAELGAAGAFLLLWTAFGLFRTGWRRAEEGSRFPAGTSVACLAGMAAASLLSTPLREQPILWTGTLLAALIFARRRPAAGDTSSLAGFVEWEMDPGRRTLFGRLAAVTFLGLVSLVVWGEQRALRASAELKIGQVACSRRDYARGLPALLNSSQLDSASLPARSLAAACALEAGQPDVAEKEIRAALRLNPSDASSWLTLAATLKERGNLTDAIAACEKARKFWPREERINLLLGDLRKLTGDNVGAAQAYGAALEGNPSSVQAYLKTGEVLQSRGQIVNSVMAFSKAANMDPFSTEALTKLGAAYMREGDLESAAQTYQSLQQLKPDDPSVLTSLAAAYRGMLRYCEVVRLLKQAREMEKEPARAAVLDSAIRDMTDKCKKGSPGPGRE